MKENEFKVGEKILVKGEISEIRHDGNIIVKSLTGDYFGVGKEAVIEDDLIDVDFSELENETGTDSTSD